MATQSVRIGWRPYVSPIQYTLDKFGSSAAAYSLRKLKVSYSGFAIRVRRSSDNTEQNIGFNTSNDLDTTALTAFVGSGSGFITTWYDQSGNSKNVIQTTANRQPWIVESGVLLTSNGKPGIKFMSDASGGYFLTGTVNRTNTNEAMSMYAVYRLLTITRQAQFGWGVIELEPGANSSGIALHRNGVFAYSPNNAAYWSTSLALGSVVFTGGLVTNNTIYYNGVARTSNITNGSNGNMQIGGTLNIGKGVYSSAKSVISELIFYPDGSQNSNVSLINNDINSYYSIYPPTVSDTDAQAFINSAYITDLTQANSINTLVIDLKTANLWTKMRAIYPFVGGTATTHKFNLKDPRDLNEAYRLLFSGGGSHDAYGYKGNGTTARATTYLTPSVMGQNDIHMSWRSSTLSTGNKAEIGTVTSTNFCGYSFNSSGTTFLARANSTAYQSAPATDSAGFYQISRKVSANYVMQKDATQTTVTATSTAPSTNNIILMGGPNSTDASDRNLQLVTLGDGLTTSEMNALRTIENTYKTNLGR